MNTRSSPTLGLATLAGILFTSHAPAAVSIDFVTVGNAGNAADTADGDVFTSGVQRYGAVADEYRMARNETSIGQYCEFLNAAAKSDPYGLYHPGMAISTNVAGITRSGGSGAYSYAVMAATANKPITLVSWFDAARFCNWLHNGQGAGSTETGAYTLNSAMSGIFQKNASATFWIPNEDEWYKAAYYDAAKNSGAGGYWRYPNQHDTLPGNTIGAAGAANYYDGDYAGSGTSSAPIGTGAALTEGGAYGPNSASYYGTNDQGGNLLEWFDTTTGAAPALRGGSWGGFSSGLESSNRQTNTGNIGPNYVGFRVASVPEPTSWLLATLAGGLLTTRRRR